MQAKRFFNIHSVLGVFILTPIMVMVICGTLSFFLKELIPWQSPELRIEDPGTLSGERFDALVMPTVSAIPEGSPRIRFNLPGAHRRTMQISWTSLDGQSENRMINPNTGEVLVTGAYDSDFADYIFRWHYLQPIPFGAEFAGFVALLWLVMSISGIYLQRKKLWSNLWKWRKRSGRAGDSWWHTTLATLTIPFHFIYSVTGVYLGGMALSILIIVGLLFGGDMNKAAAALEPLPEPIEKTGIEVAPAAPGQFLEIAYAALPKTKFEYISLEYWHDSAARIRFSGKDGLQRVREVAIDASSKKITYLRDETASLSAYEVVHQVLMLHFANFGGYPVRFLYTFAGIAMAVLIYLSSRMYFVRMERESNWWTRLQERFFDGFAIGLLPAIGIYGITTRLLPLEMIERDEMEALIFHVSWVLIGGAVLLSKTGPKVRRGLMVSALLIAGVIPILDGLLHGHWLWSEAVWVVPEVGWINLVLTVMLFFGVYLNGTNSRP